MLQDVGKGDDFASAGIKPVADNLVYQNFPAMAFGFPILILATMAPTQPYLTLAIVFVFMIAINILLFRSFIFKKKKVKA